MSLTDTLNMSTYVRGRGQEGHGAEGVTGLKSLGVRDLTYRLAFLATTVTPTDLQVYRLAYTFDSPSLPSPSPHPPVLPIPSLFLLPLHLPLPSPPPCSLVLSSPGGMT